MLLWNSQSVFDENILRTSVPENSMQINDYTNNRIKGLEMR